MPAQIWTRSFSNTQNTMNHMRAEQTQILSRYSNNLIMRYIHVHAHFCGMCILLLLEEKNGKVKSYICQCPSQSSAFVLTHCGFEHYTLTNLHVEQNFPHCSIFPLVLSNKFFFLQFLFNPLPPSIALYCRKSPVFTCYF